MINFELKTNTSTSSNSSGVVLIIAGGATTGANNSTIASGYITNSSNSNSITFTSPGALAADIFNNIYIVDNQGAAGSLLLRQIKFNNISSTQVDATPILNGYTYSTLIDTISGVNNANGGIISVNGLTRPGYSFEVNGDAYHTGVISASGFLMVGQASTNHSSSGYVLQVYGKMHATGNIRALGTITQTSDIRLKQNISQIQLALHIVENLRGVYYTKKEDLRKQKHIGLIAQEVEEYLPEVVWTDSISEEKTKSVSYDNIVSVLVEAIKELRSELKELQCIIDSLSSETTAT